MHYNLWRRGGVDILRAVLYNKIKIVRSECLGGVFGEKEKV